VSDADIEILTAGTLTPAHAVQFRAFVKQLRHKYAIASIIEGKERWPDKPEERDVLYFLAQSFRAHLLKNLPDEKEHAGAREKELIFAAKARIKELAAISFEIAQMVVADDGENLPGYFMVEIVRDLPRLVQKVQKNG
ncbi:MAG: hypothetical protein LBD04_01670, partial [Synergistaceae bacterium]|nr:hypothetical protein [Synergistaceae bacterium]